MTKLMLDGGRDDSEDKENRKGNRRETWAPGLAGTVDRATAHKASCVPGVFVHLRMHAVAGDWNMLLFCI